MPVMVAWRYVCIGMYGGALLAARSAVVETGKAESKQSPCKFPMNNVEIANNTATGYLLWQTTLFVVMVRAFFSTH